MPKKKQTKTRVRRLINVVRRDLYLLMIDRLNFGTKSEVKMTFNKIEEFYTAIGKAQDKI
jgi:hypothetical protein|tara:strand:- start:36 stop:215 length:180 start_codon:yes stop_codon:yes gene_type:complete